VPDIDGDGDHVNVNVNDSEDKGKPVDPGHWPNPCFSDPEHGDIGTLCQELSKYIQEGAGALFHYFLALAILFI
jgi:hypothetical protein